MLHACFMEWANFFLAFRWWFHMKYWLSYYKEWIAFWIVTYLISNETHRKTYVSINHDISKRMTLVIQQFANQSKLSKTVKNQPILYHFSLWKFLLFLSFCWSGVGLIGVKNLNHFISITGWRCDLGICNRNTLPSFAIGIHWKYLPGRHRSVHRLQDRPLWYPEHPNQPPSYLHLFPYLDDHAPGFNVQLGPFYWPTRCAVCLVQSFDCLHRRMLLLGVQDNL